MTTKYYRIIKQQIGFTSTEGWHNQAVKPQIYYQDEYNRLYSEDEIISIICNLEKVNVSNPGEA